MKNNFNQRVTGVSPEQTRLALRGSNQNKSMVEQEQLVPTLKPSFGLGQAVDNHAHKQKLKQEQQRVRRYQIKVTEVHTTTMRMNGQVISTKVDRQVQHINRAKQLSNDFNQETAQAHDIKQMGLSF